MTPIVFILLVPFVLSEDYLAEFDDEIETKRFGELPSKSSRNYDASLDSYSSGSPTANTSLGVSKNQPSVSSSIDLEPLPGVPKSSVGGCGGGDTVKTSFAPGVAPGGCGASTIQGCGGSGGCGTVNSGSCGNPFGGYNSPYSGGGCGAPSSGYGSPSPCSRGGCGQPYPFIPYYPQYRPCPQPRPCPYYPPRCPPTQCPPPTSCPSCNCGRPPISPWYSPPPCGGFRPSGYGGCGNTNPYYGTPNYYGGGRSVNDCCCNCRGSCRVRQRKTFALFGIRTITQEFDQPNALCNNLELRLIIKNNISSNVDETKRRVQRQAEARLGRTFNVICGSGEFSYVVHTESYCQYTDLQTNITCYVFSNYL